MESLAEATVLDPIHRSEELCVPDRESSRRDRRLSLSVLRSACEAAAIRTGSAMEWMERNGREGNRERSSGSGKKIKGDSERRRRSGTGLIRMGIKGLMSAFYR